MIEFLLHQIDQNAQFMSTILAFMGGGGLVILTNLVNYLLKRDAERDNRLFLARQTVYSESIGPINQWHKKAPDFLVDKAILLAGRDLRNLLGNWSQYRSLAQHCITTGKPSSDPNEWNKFVLVMRLLITEIEQTMKLELGIKRLQFGTVDFSEKLKEFQQSLELPMVKVDFGKKQ